jgi:hypothetical protein
MVAVSFIGGGNRKIRRKPPTCRNVVVRQGEIKVKHLVYA